MQYAPVILQELNPEQRKAVETTQGKLLILAGAGCGKTKVLMARMAHLIQEHGISPTAIVGLTFTNKAAQEMRARLSTLVGSNQARGVTLCTFHSFCLKLLREHAHRLGFTRYFTLYHEHDVRRLVQQIVHDELEHEGQIPSLGATLARLDQARSAGVQPKDLEVGDELWHHKFCQVIYERLKMAFRAYDAMDFDALLEYTVQLLQEDPHIAALVHARYQYVMVDEYQDTNPIQDRLATLLASHGNLCVVGDDDQSIYGWRGSQVRNILEFPADCKIKLEQNYRSTSRILDAANHVIALNTERHQKKLWSQKGEGFEIDVFHAPSEALEAQTIVKRLLILRERENLAWRDFAILYRSNALARSIETALLREMWQDVEGKWHRAIPYEVFGGDSFYDCREVRDILAYLRLLVNPRDQEALLRIINQPRRGVGEGTIDRLTSDQRTRGGILMEYVQAACNSLDVVSTARQGLNKLCDLLHTARDRFSLQPLDESLKWFIEAIQYEKAIQEEVKSEAMRELKRKNLQQLCMAAGEFMAHSTQEGLERLSEFLGASHLDESTHDHVRVRQADSVHLMTFHSAKGLEFPYVFLVGIEDHILPHERSLELTGIEEERRLFYVAITRAQLRLTMSMAMVRDRYGKVQASQPSRFLFDIPKNLLRLHSWEVFPQA